MTLNCDLDNESSQDPDNDLCHWMEMVPSGLIFV